MHAKSTHCAPVAILGLLLPLPALYVGSYLALVERVGPLQDSVTKPLYMVGYRAGGGWAPRIFAPLHALDRKVRAGYWEPAE